jgi:protein-tyrosine phosphatase
MSMRRIFIVLVAIISLGWWLKNRRPRIEYPSADSLIIPIPANAHDGGERFIPIDGTVNFREIGGYRTQDGKTVKRGALYRSDKLDDLTEQGQQQLQALGVQAVCDLRGMSEVERHPDNLPASITYYHLPIEAENDTFGSLCDYFFNKSRLRESIYWMYHELFIEGHPQMFGEAINQVAQADKRPVVLHCTAGKDRTGLITAMILDLLGVPDEVIVADYTLSNHSYNHLRDYTVQRLGNLSALGIKADDLWPLLVCDPDFMISSLVHIRGHYGSIENYLLTKGGVSADTIAQLRETLLSE